jgi:elongation factor G
LGATWSLKEIRPELADKAAEMRAELIELIVEQDDDVMEKFLDGEEPDVETIQRLIRKGTLNMSFVPVLCGSAFKNKGCSAFVERRYRLFAGSIGCCCLHWLCARRCN